MIGQDQLLRLRALGDVGDPVIEARRSPQLRVHDPDFSLESGAQRTTLGMRANHVKASFRRARCGFSRSWSAGHALLLSVFEPLEAVDGWSVIYSIHDCRTASDRAFFRGVDVCG